MPEQYHPQDAPTEAIPIAPDERSTWATKELPVVTEPIAQPPIVQPPIAQPPIAQPPIAQPPIAQPPIAHAPVGYAPPPPHNTSAPPAVVATGRRPPAARRKRRGRLAAALLALVVLGGAAGAAAGYLLQSRDGEQSTASPSASPTPLTVSASSVDPVGGTGLRNRDGTWQTVTYRTAAFGNLKPGVGLLLDLGQARKVSSVSFDAGPGPITVELRAGDAPAGNGEAYTLVGAPTTANGATNLEGTSGGAHRYWMIWITKLAATDGGYRAVLSEPRVSGT